jgi:prepilin-type N-terminal cleavage/methylation domain-containing protein
MTPRATSHVCRQRGFTLIELMISVTLVAAISTGMLMAIRTSLITLQKIDDRLQSNRRVMSVEQILSRELGGVMPVKCGSVGNVAAFNGNQQTLHLVSSYSMAEGARGYPRVLEFQVLPAEGGSVRLVVNEFLYSGPLSTAPFCVGGAFGPGQATPQSFVLADRLAYCRISYQQRNAESMMGETWLPVWNQPNLPAAVRIDMEPLIPDAAHLPLVPVTVPIHVNREVMSQYADAP